MKYPWVAFSVMVVWFGTTYMVLSRSDLEVYKFLGAMFVGTIIIAFIGFRPAKINR